MGFMSRLLASNCSNVKEALQLHRNVYRRHVRATDVALFSELAGVPKPWFEWRIPQSVERDRWTEFELFGHRWRSDWLLRGTHQQVCPHCLAESGFARLEWDLQPYVACHIHGTVLQDHCGDCGKAILPDRPSLDVCGCAGFITHHPPQAIAAPTVVVRWCAWLSAQLNPLAGPTSISADDGLPTLCAGCSPDGAYRLIQALAGGPRAFRGAQMDCATPWLSTSATLDVLQTGIETLECLARGTRPVRRPDKGAADGLAEQAVRGVTAWDRAAASRLANELNARSRWRNVKPAIHQQLELFEVRP